MALDKFIYIHSIGTDALYNDAEKHRHDRLIKLYKLRNSVKENCKDDDVAKWRLKSINRVIKQEKAALSEMLDKSLEHDSTRTLRPDAIRDKDVINIFCSELTRALGIEPFSLSDELIMVNVFFFQIFNSIMHHGFVYNGEKYIYYTASAGQIRTKRMIAIKESSYEKIKDRLMCGLTVDKINERGGMNQNKFSSYLALTCSATDIWEGFDVRKAIVVDDFETVFKSDVDYIDYQTYEIERKNMDVTIPCTDGWGMVDGQTTRMCRLPWIKGLLTNFRFKDWLRENCIPEQWIVDDIWGNEHDVVNDDIQYIFTKSQMKLSKFYDSWAEYCDAFEAYGCQACYCNMEEQDLRPSRINYQMLQQLVAPTDYELNKIVSRTNKEIAAIGVDYRTTMRLLGAVDSNENKSLLQEALMLYPELFRDEYFKDILKQTKKSLNKQARAGRLRINGKYLFVSPNPITFCRWLFKDEKSPDEDFGQDEIYTNQFFDGDELAVLRSPSLGKEWAIRRNKRNEHLDKWLGDSKCIYTSSYDTISKMLAFDCDGDRLLVVKDKTLISVAKRTMQGVVPLYYEMKKAKGGLLTADSMYESMSLAYTCGNIGPISNLISVVHNNNEKDREEADKVVKWLTMETNFTINISRLEQQCSSENLVNL